jgi:hypothetical protein
MKIMGLAFVGAALVQVVRPPRRPLISCYDSQAHDQL